MGTLKKLLFTLLLLLLTLALVCTFFASAKGNDSVMFENLNASSNTKNSQLDSLGDEDSSSLFVSNNNGSNAIGLYEEKVTVDNSLNTLNTIVNCINTWTQFVGLFLTLLTILIAILAYMGFKDLKNIKKKLEKYKKRPRKMPIT